MTTGWVHGWCNCFGALPHILDSTLRFALRMLLSVFLPARVHRAVRAAIRFSTSRLSCLVSSLRFPTRRPSIAHVLPSRLLGRCPFNFACYRTPRCFRFPLVLFHPDAHILVHRWSHHRCRRHFRHSHHFWLFMTVAGLHLGLRHASGVRTANSPLPFAAQRLLLPLTSASVSSSRRLCTHRIWNSVHLVICTCSTRHGARLCFKDFFCLCWRCRC